MKFDIDFWIILSIPAFILYMLFATIGSIILANHLNFKPLPYCVLISMTSFLILILLKIGEDK